jgi:hypothetical protein
MQKHYRYSLAFYKAGVKVAARRCYYLVESQIPENLWTGRKMYTPDAAVIACARTIHQTTGADTVVIKEWSWSTGKYEFWCHDADAATIHLTEAK